MKYGVLLWFCLGLNSLTWACLNEYNVNERGIENDEYAGLPVFYRSFDTAFARQEIARVDLTVKSNYDYQVLSDAGIQLTKLRRYKEALDLFRWLIHRYPEAYQINANLGTLYEINGQIDSAYFRIRKSLELNPDSHFGSEWVHLAILNVKKRLQRTPDWLLNHQVLGLGLTDTVPNFSQAHDQILDTIRQITYQLEERIPFTPDEDLIVANILMELGDLLRIHISVEDAFVAYKMAAHYDPNDVLGTHQIAGRAEDVLSEYNLSPIVFYEHFPNRAAFDEFQSSGIAIDSETVNQFGRFYYFGAGALVLLAIILGWRRLKKTKKD